MHRWQRDAHRRPTRLSQLAARDVDARAVYRVLRGVALRLPRAYAKCRAVKGGALVPCPPRQRSVSERVRRIQQAQRYMLPSFLPVPTAIYPAGVCDARRAAASSRRTPAVGKALRSSRRRATEGRRRENEPMPQRMYSLPRPRPRYSRGEAQRLCRRAIAAPPIDAPA